MTPNALNSINSLNSPKDPIGSSTGLRLPVRMLTCVVMALGAGAAMAGPTVNLDADARTRVANDEMVVVLAADRDNPDPGVANNAVVKLLNEAIDRAKRVTGVVARLGNVSTQPIYTAQGKPSGYRVHGEVVLESRNFSDLASLSGELAQRMLLADVSFRASRALRDREEQRLLGDAATAFRARAQAIATAFGQHDYEIKTMTVSSRSPGGVRPMRAMSDSGLRAAAPLPTEGGDTELVVAVTGSVELR